MRTAICSRGRRHIACSTQDRASTGTPQTNAFRYPPTAYSTWLTIRLSLVHSHTQARTVSTDDCCVKHDECPPSEPPSSARIPRDTHGTVAMNTAHSKTGARVYCYGKTACTCDERCSHHNLIRAGFRHTFDGFSIFHRLWKRRYSRQHLRSLKDM